MELSKLVSVFFFFHFLAWIGGRRQKSGGVSGKGKKKNGHGSIKGVRGGRVFPYYKPTTTLGVDM